MPKKRTLPSPDTLYEQAKHALLRDIKNKIEGIITNCPHSRSYWPFFDEESSDGDTSPNDSPTSLDTYPLLVDDFSRDGDIFPPPDAQNSRDREIYPPPDAQNSRDGDIFPPPDAQNSRDGDISPLPDALNDILQLTLERKSRFCRKCAKASPHVIEPESLCTLWAEDLYCGLLDRIHKVYFFKSVIGWMQKIDLLDFDFDLVLEEDRYDYRNIINYVIALIQSEANYIRVLRLPNFDTKYIKENVKNILIKFGGTINELRIPQSFDTDLGNFPIQQITEFCRNLQTLYLYKRITQDDLSHLNILNLINEHEFSSLKKLMIFYASHETNHIPDIFQQLHCLGVINLQLKNHDVLFSASSVSFNCYNLYELYIYCIDVRRVYFISSILINPSYFLTSLFLITNIYCTIDVFQLLQDLPSLIKLTICGSLVKRDFAATRLSCHPLKTLAIADLTLTLYKLGRERACNSISEIAIDDFYLIDLLRWCKNLEVLILDDVKEFSEFVIEEVIYPTEESVYFTCIQDANKFPNLRKIDISEAQYFGKDGIFTLLDLDNDLHNMRFNRCYLSTKDKDAIEKYIMDNDLDVAVIFDSRNYYPDHAFYKLTTKNPHFSVDSID